MPKIKMSDFAKDRFLEVAKSRTLEDLKEQLDDIKYIASVEALSLTTPEDLEWQINIIQNEINKRHHQNK